MKTLPALALLAALVAFFVLPVSTEVAGSLLFAAGLVAILRHDYSRRLTPAELGSNRAVAQIGQPQRLPLAA